MAPPYKVVYFDIMGLAEPIRILLSYGALEFEDCRISRENWPNLKPIRFFTIFLSVFVKTYKSTFKEKKMGEGNCETLPEGQSKKSRHRKKHLYSTILQQMEFYFSDSNLTKDRFLSQLLSKSPYIDIGVFLNFNKIRKLNCTVEDIQKALKSSDLIEVSEDGLKLSRKKPIKVNENIDLCTIYVENIKSDTTHETLTQIFSDFGNVVYVSIPKYKQNKTNKGFAFIEYENETQAVEAITFFESIGCRIPTDGNPEELQSIATFEKDDLNEKEVTTNKEQSTSDKPTEETPIKGGKKRKLSGEENTENKKLKFNVDVKSIDQTLEEETDGKKKKKNKKEKRKTFIKELGMQVLSKKEWKRLRNRYLDLQRKKMKEFKQHLRKQGNYKKNTFKDAKTTEENQDEGSVTKLAYVPGVIVKMKLLEPCLDVKKLKSEIKVFSPEVKYVDVTSTTGSDEVTLRFGDAEAAKEFCNKDFMGEKVVLTEEEEELYWNKINEDRTVKFQKLSGKQRGREKLLKKAEKHIATHLRFDENE